MHDFRYVGGKLYCEGIAVENLARKFGTPLYIYSQKTLTDHFLKLDRAMTGVDHLICFAVKSNSNLSVLRTLAGLGSGFDIVSGGELQRVIAAGGDPRRCAFAGVGKGMEEIEFALKKIEEVYARASRLKNLRLGGLQMHIGSQITAVNPFEEAVRKVLPLVNRLKQKYGLEFFSIGGGLGIIYEPALASGAAAWWQSGAARNVLTPGTYAARLLPLLKPLGLRVLMEPGRFISGNAGILVTRVEYVKHTGNKHFLIVDAAMNDLIRPAFYEAYHEIVPLTRNAAGREKSDVVGPICESGDFFCQDRPLPKVAPGEYLALMSAGAYGFVMASNYNTRPLPAELLVNGKQAALVRQRQKLASICRDESIAPWLE